MPDLTPHDEAMLRELARQLEPNVAFRRAWRPGGGVSAEVSVIELERRDGQRRRLLVRRHGEADRTHNPHIARDEFALLGIAHAQGLAVPRPVHLDESNKLFPTPVLVLEYVEGETEFAPTDLAAYLTQAAGQLARIHALPALPALSFLPRQDPHVGPRPAQLDATLDEGCIRDALEAAGPVPRVQQPVLLHGDYWPGNLLWRDGRLVAVIDWEDACLGDPLADLGNARLELLWAFGPDAMTAFADRYLTEATIDVGALPYWDLVAALRPCGQLGNWGLPPETERRMRERHAWFVAHAIARLGTP